jgi:uncharacterized protein with GYD domain
MKQISDDRTKQTRQLIEDLGGRVKDMYALLGEYDLVFIVDFPNMTNAMKASVALGHLTGINFSTSAAIPVEEFDELMGHKPD